MSILGDTLKCRRGERGLSLAELARRVGISKGYLHSIESGDTKNPSAEILFRIANELGTTIADLLGQGARSEEKFVPIPSTLKDFAAKENLPEEDIVMLAGIEYRGKKPATEEDWRYIYEFIKRTLK